MRFLQPGKTLSMDFGSTSIKLVEGKYTKKGINIYKKFTVDLPRNVYDDGVIHNMHILRETLANSLASNKISTDLVNGVINSSQIITREITLPKLAEKEIEAILSYQIEDYIPISAEDYIVQCIILNTIYDEGVERYNLLLVAIPKDMVEAHLNLFTNLNLKPRSLDFQGNAITKILGETKMINNNFSKEGKILATIDIGYSKTKLTLIEDDSIKITRIIDFGTREVIEDIAESLNISEIDADKFLSNISLVDDYAEDSHESSVQNILRSNLIGFMDSIEMVFRYYRSMDMNNRVDLILVHGGISSLEGIEHVLKNFFEINCTLLNSLEGIDINEPMWKYANAIGGLIRKDGV